MLDAAAMVDRLYRRLGTPATHMSAASGIETAVHVILDMGGGDASIAGLMQGDSPSLKLPAAAVTAGVRKGDTFQIGATTWRAREAGQPLRDGAELLVSLAKD
ncbi:head-tail joining protein [Caldimonas tepidiphila]|uniref:head-tail joining protein n=1 Tax=Caldimonas tepidiphila TaxID=2315841 RepID=UPI000E5B1528|nr:hypothetical protein [Caldimonas tepidiphila]